MPPSPSTLVTRYCPMRRPMVAGVVFHAGAPRSRSARSRRPSVVRAREQELLDLRTQLPIAVHRRSRGSRRAGRYRGWRRCSNSACNRCQRSGLGCGIGELLVQPGLGEVQLAGNGGCGDRERLLRSRRKSVRRSSAAPRCCSCAHRTRASRVSASSRAMRSGSGSALTSMASSIEIVDLGAAALSRGDAPWRGRRGCDASGGPRRRRSERDHCHGTSMSTRRTKSLVDELRRLQGVTATLR